MANEYFSNFNTRFYQLKGDKKRLVTDILHRVGVRKNVKDNKAFFFEYDVQDEDTPEIVADKLYDDPHLYWLVLMVNNMIDPHFDWPLSSQKLSDHIKAKFPGSALFLKNISGSFTEGETVTDASSGATATVHDWNRTYKRLQVKSISGSFAKGNTINGGSSGASATIGRIIADNTAALHHFENDDGETLDPYDDDTAYLDGYINNTGNSVIEAAVVTNRDHEENINEGKRSVKLIRPEYVTDIVQEFERVLNG